MFIVFLVPTFIHKWGHLLIYVHKRRIFFYVSLIKHFPWCGGGVAESWVTHHAVFLFPSLPSLIPKSWSARNQYTVRFCMLSLDQRTGGWEEGGGRCNGSECYVTWLMAVPALPRWAVDAAACLSSLSHTHTHHSLLGWDWLQTVINATSEFYKKNI